MKRRIRKRAKPRRRVRRAKRAPVVSNKMVNLTKLKNNFTFPQAMMIKQHFQLNGYVPAGSATGYFDIALNSVPFTPSAVGLAGSEFTDATNGSGVLLAGSTIGEVSNDWSKLITIYQDLRVLSARISVTAEPRALADTINMYIIPWTVDQFNTNVPANMDTRLGLEPRCKWKVCSSNYASQHANTINHSVSVPIVFGMKRSAVLNSSQFRSDVGAGSVAQNTVLFRVCWLTTNATNLSVPLSFRVKFDQVTRLEELVTTFV